MASYSLENELRSYAGLKQQCEKAEVEIARLKQALSDRDSREAGRFGRLEHDLRASIGVIVGFSSLLRETVDADPEGRPTQVLKSANAIHQAATKALRIIDEAADEYARARSPQLENESDRLAGGDIEAYSAR